MKSSSIVALLLCALSLQAAQGDIGSAINSAINTVQNAVDTATDAVSDATSTAVDAVTNAVSTGTDAVESAVQTGLRTAEHTVNISENWLTNTASNVASVVVNFTEDQWNSAASLADQVGSSISSVTGSAVSVGRQIAGQIDDTASSITSDGTPPPRGIDATDPAAILESLSGAGGFPPVSTGILQAIAADRGADVATATASVLTTNSSNATVQVQVAQAYAAAMGIAQNDTSDVSVNSTQVAEVFMASLQDAILPCAQRLQPPGELGSPEYSQAVAEGCCKDVDRALSTEAMVTDLINVEDAFYAALQNSDGLGTRPQLNLGRCLNRPESS